jgi:membrane carboxypeptidase/penicillin-binding protein
MPTASKTIQFRQRRYSREGFSLGAKIGLLSAILLSLAAVTLIFFAVNVYHQITQNLPSIDLLPSLIEPPDGSFLQPTRFYDRTHQHVILTLQNPTAADKQYIKLVMSDGQISNQSLQYLANATIVSDDPGFWDEPRFDLKGISQGSQYTILQRLVDKLFLANVLPSTWRDITDRLLEYQLIEKYGRLKILEWYLNTAQYGKFIYGADAAARAYFGKTAEYITLGEAAMLAAFEQKPSLDPSIDAPNLREMQVQVIFKMLDQGLIGSSEAQEALKENIQFQPQIAPESLSPEFTNLVLEQLSQYVSLPQVYQGGFEIITSLDFELQNQATCASLALQARLHTHQGSEIPLSDPTCAAANFFFTTSDIEKNSDQSIDIGVVIMNPENGQVLAMVGDDGTEVNPSYPRQHPVGTSVSPFLYLTAFTQGMGPASLLWDIPTLEAINSSDVSSESSQINWSAYHGPVSLRTALVNDYLGVAGSLYQKLGSDNVWQTEEKFGIHATIDISTAQATIEGYYSQQASLLEITQAYGVLANQGFMSGQPSVANLQQYFQHLLTSSTILSVFGNDRKTWLDLTKYESIPLVSPQLAFLTTQVLSDLSARLPGAIYDSLLKINRPIAYKTAMSNDDNSAWTIGYTPQIVVGVWVDDKQAEYSLQPELAFDLWQAITKYAIQDLPIQAFVEPPGISHVWVCDPSGMLASTVCPSEKEELFLSGTEPSQLDTLFKKYWVDRETGLLASIFTPADLIDEKVYISVPSRAEEWARQTGFPMPPQNYDSFPAPPPSADAEISTPEMNAYIGGVVNFYGSAGGDDFAYYRLQVGEGQYPQEWMQIGKNFDQPVQDGLLGSWDTSGLQGNYVVELLVVKQDRRIEQTYLPVIVDNTAPKVKILAPENHGVFMINQEEIIILQASIEDDFRVKQVEFAVDHQWIYTLYEPPYVVLWPAQIGQHELKISAYDMVGNSHEENTTFLVTR